MESIEEQIREAATVARQLHALVSEHELRGAGSGAPITSMKKRSIPLGIIGSLSKSLFETMNEDDAEYINSQIDRLFSDQENVTKIIGNQIHITASRIQ